MIFNFVKVSLRLTSLLSQDSANTITSVIRNESQSPEIISRGAKPAILSLEESPTKDFTQLFEQTKANVVYFSAGAGGKGGEERTKKVDYEGALKIFDAIEGVNGEKPRLILVSAIDLRDPDKIPAHYVCPPNYLEDTLLKNCLG